jgi:transcriptional regulator with XRE-family HTH domain
VDDRRVGSSFRAIRMRLGLTQDELGIASATSRPIVGRIEQGRLNGVSLRALRRVATALDMDLNLSPRWRGGDLGRLLNARHSALHEAVAARFAALREWRIEPEVSYSIAGERGVIDLLAWHPGSRSLLVVELKTEIVDVNDLMGSMDRRVRLAPQIGGSRGWRPDTVACWVVVPDTRTNRRIAARHAVVLRAKFPDDGRRVAAWLREPAGVLRALGFLPTAAVASTGAAIGGTRHVRHGRSTSPRPVRP